jgi:VIT1/CCC1 family predicted Fe2+/Mn2+ transporter
MTKTAPRPSVHVEPDGLYQTAQHYVGDLIYGANDGILTTFAVVAGVSGGALSVGAVLIVGMANLFADGLSMGVGNYFAIRARESALESQDRPAEESEPVRHGAARSLVTASRWWVSGLEMLGLGFLVALVVYATGAGISSLMANG